MISAATARSKWRAEIVTALREMTVIEDAVTESCVTEGTATECAVIGTLSEKGPCDHEHGSENEHEHQHDEHERECGHEHERGHEREEEHEHEAEHQHECNVGRPPPIITGTHTTSTRKWTQPPPTPRGCLGRGA